MIYAKTQRRRAAGAKRFECAELALILALKYEC
jgi:hypothetical protein